MTDYSRIQHISDGSPAADIFLSHFRPAGGGAAEYHAMIVPCGHTSFAGQIGGVAEALKSLQERIGSRAVTVFARLFLSDIANQPVDIGLFPSCPLSVVGQPPLFPKPLKCALWVFFREDVGISRLPEGFSEVSYGSVTELWQASDCRPGLDSYQATSAMLTSCAEQLRDYGCSLRDNCLRTWFFVRDVDINYAGVVKGRNDVFDREGLTSSTHYIASTGIGGDNADRSACVTFDSYSVKGLDDGAVKYLYGASHLNRTSDYGVAFERGVAIDLGDRVRVFISGTASIDNKGEIMYPGDIVRQTGRMCENVEVLLDEASMRPSDIQQAIVYVRDTADADVVGKLIEARYPGLPFVLVLAPVCRPGWLVEMECIASR